jgi:M6 family metalloprotease-like protein
LSGIPLAPGQSLSLRGKRSIPVISVEFKNIAASFTPADYQTLLFDEGENSWSMSTYYRKASNGMFEVSGNVLGPYKLGERYCYEGKQGLGGRPLRQL